MQALVDPFEGPLACVPCDFLNSNLINRVFVKGSFACGSNIGFIAADVGRSCFSDTHCVISSKASFTGTNMDLNATADINLDFSNAQYAATQVGVQQGNLAYRPVACGLRIRYTGTTLNQGGTINALHDPTHSSMYLRNNSQMDGELQSRRFSVSRKWTTVYYRPVSSGGQNMTETPPTLAGETSPTITAATIAWYMGMIVIPPSSTSFSTFEYELFTVVEYQGRNVRGQKITHADAVGFAGAVQTMAFVAPTQAAPAELKKATLTRVADYLATGASHIADGTEFFDSVMFPSNTCR
jgi:hypothetical protein